MAWKKAFPVDSSSTSFEGATGPKVRKALPLAYAIFDAASRRLI
jgi:hypothetical protein